MSKPPKRPPSTRKTNALRDVAAGRLLVAKPADPRQAGLFDEAPEVDPALPADARRQAACRAAVGA